MWKLLSNFLYFMGGLNKKDEEPIPEGSGYWKNLGTDRDEEWAWVDLKVVNPPQYLSVHQEGGNFLITLDDKPDYDAIESVECKGDKDIEVTMELLIAYYSKLGNVVTSKMIE